MAKLLTTKRDLLTIFFLPLQVKFQQHHSVHANLCEESLNLLAWSVFRMNISQHENLKSRIPEVHFGCLRQNETLYFRNNLTHSFVFSLTFTLIYWYLNKSDWTEGVLRLLDRRQSHQILSFFYLFSLCSLCYFNIFIIKMMPFSTSRLKMVLFTFISMLCKNVTRVLYDMYKPDLT